MNELAGPVRPQRRPFVRAALTALLLWAIFISGLSLSGVQMGGSLGLVDLASGAVALLIAGWSCGLRGLAEWTRAALLAISIATVVLLGAWFTVSFLLPGGYE